MNIRLTPKRKQILDALKDAHDIQTAADLQRSLPKIDLATIYRNLDLFVQHKLIKRIYLREGEAGYEYQHVPHHHAVCSNCQKVLHFNIPESVLRKHIPVEGFSIEEIEVTVKGVCAHRE